MLGTLCGYSADVVGLQQRAVVKINAQMAGAPFQDSEPPFIWAIAFSPDKRHLAFGVEFARKKDHSFRSYLVVVSAERPDVAQQKFETSTRLEHSFPHTLVWSDDSRFLALTPFGDWDRAGVVDIDAHQLHIVPDRMGVVWCGSAVSVVTGPRIVQACSHDGSQDTMIRFLGLDGTAEPEWTLAGELTILSVSPDRKILAVDRKLPGKNPRIALHEVTLFNISDRTEARRWLLPEADVYLGTFALWGTAFCTLEDPFTVRIKHELVCRDIASGEIRTRRSFPVGPIGDLAAVGDELLLLQSRVLMLPFELFDTHHILTREDWYLSDLQTGELIARWRLPNSYGAFESSSVSPDGEMVATGESGVIRIYRVLR